MSNTVLTIFLILAMIATAVALVRGIIAFLQTTETELKSNSEGPSPSQIKQNQMMRNRILFQGIAIVIVAIMLALAR
jgi:CHASE3 domain sensor protein